MPDVTFLVRLAVVLVAAGVLTVSSAASPGGGLRSVAFVAIHGHGSVTSSPHGIRCPGACRAIYAKNAHVTLHATPAAGWRFVHFEGFCAGTSRVCAFDLVSTHDCVGGACPVGAFGVRAIFVRRAGTM